MKDIKYIKIFYYLAVIFYFLLWALTVFFLLFHPENKNIYSFLFVFTILMGFTIITFSLLTLNYHKRKNNTINNASKSDFIGNHSKSKFFNLIIIFHFVYFFIIMLVKNLYFDGSPELKDGMYYLYDKTEIIEEITKSKYFYFKAFDLIFIMSHFLLTVFFSISIFYNLLKVYK